MWTLAELWLLPLCVPSCFWVCTWVPGFPAVPCGPCAPPSPFSPGSPVSPLTPGWPSTPWQRKRKLVWFDSRLYRFIHCYILDTTATCWLSSEATYRRSREAERTSWTRLASRTLSISSHTHTLYLEEMEVQPFKEKQSCKIKCTDSNSSWAPASCRSWWASFTLKHRNSQVLTVLNVLLIFGELMVITHHTSRFKLHSNICAFELTLSPLGPTEPTGPTGPGSPFK